MIRAVSSDLPSFKSIQFRPGLNVLLADKSPGASARQTRNGAGKTSLVELVHFLLGAKCGPDSLFRTSALAPSTFTMTFDLAGSPVTAARSGEKSSDLTFEGDWSEWPLTPSKQRKTGRHILKNEAWKTVLGSLFFGLPENTGDGTWSPTFRSLFAYFARRERSGAFLSTFQQSSRQAVWDQQIAITYLLGLDWTIPQQWQEVREKEKNLAELKKAMAGGAVGPVVESAAALRTRLAVAEDSGRKARAALMSFKVLEQYHELEVEASRLTRELSTLADESAIDRAYLTELETATASEELPATADMERLYKEAGVVLPDIVRKRFEDVQLFHESVVRNRRAYLTGEIDATKIRLRDRQVSQSRVDARRSEVMAILRSHGALEQYTALQVELSRLEGQTEILRQKFDAAEALESGQLTLNYQRTHLLDRLRQDHREQRETLNRAAIVFGEISRQLYERPGELVIAAMDNGPRFDIQIHAEQSRGISNMQTFCFDLMLMQLCSERGIGPGFLLHDSHLFDGVDERQIGKALDLGARLATEHGFQYIVTMNSDAVPRELPAAFSLESFILPVRLTDATESGGLFGVRFE